MTTITSPQSIKYVDTIFNQALENELEFFVELPFDTFLEFLPRLDCRENFDPKIAIEGLKIADKLIPRDLYSEDFEGITLYNDGRKHKINVAYRDEYPVITLHWCEHTGDDDIEFRDLNEICRIMEEEGGANNSWFDIEPFYGSRCIKMRFTWF